MTELCSTAHAGCMSLPQHKITPDEYLAWEADQPDKHEFYRGEIFAMVGASRVHAEVTRNFLVALDNALRERPCRAYGSDVKVRVETADAYYYPDVLVTCAESDLRATQVMTQPTVIVEVLSPSTALYDRGLKFAAYRQLPSLRQYVLVDPDLLIIETYLRTETGGWLLRDVARGAELALPDVGVSLPWAEVFRYVDPVVVGG